MFWRRLQDTLVIIAWLAVMPIFSWFSIVMIEDYLGARRASDYGRNFRGPHPDF